MLQLSKKCNIYKTRTRASAHTDMTPYLGAKETVNTISNLQSTGGKLLCPYENVKLLM